jgi:hypothetical protein
MELKSQIEKEIKEDHLKASKITIEKSKIKALNNKDYFDALVKLGLTDQKPYCWRCSWVISKIAMIDNSLIYPYIRQIINLLDGFKYDSQIGGFLKTLSLCGQIDEDQMGILADYCIKIIFDTQRPSHNKYYAIQILLKISKKYPELAREFSLVIEENLPYFTKPYLKKFGKGSLVILRG